MVSIRLRKRRNKIHQQFTQSLRMKKQPFATTVVNASFNLGFQIRGHNLLPFSIYYSCCKFRIYLPFLFEYLFHWAPDPYLWSSQIENVGNGCGNIELHHALLKFRNPFDVLPGNNKRRFKLLKRLPAVTFPDAPWSELMMITVSSHMPASFAAYTICPI